MRHALLSITLVRLSAGFVPSTALPPMAARRASTARGRGGAPRASAGDEPAAATGGGKGVVLGALVATYASNQWCRALLFSTVDFGSTDAFRFANAALDLTKGEYALLGTVAFNALFAACSLAAGALVDRTDAARLTWASCALWSGATAAAGLADSFGASGAGSGRDRVRRHFNMSWIRPYADVLRTSLSRDSLVCREHGSL